MTEPAPYYIAFGLRGTSCVAVHRASVVQLRAAEGGAPAAAPPPTLPRWPASCFAAVSFPPTESVTEQGCPAALQAAYRERPQARGMHHTAHRNCDGRRPAALPLAPSFRPSARSLGLLGLPLGRRRLPARAALGGQHQDLGGDDAVEESACWAGEEAQGRAWPSLGGTEPHSRAGSLSSGVDSASPCPSTPALQLPRPAASGWPAAPCTQHTTGSH